MAPFSVGPGVCLGRFGSKPNYQYREKRKQTTTHWIFSSTKTHLLEQCYICASNPRENSPIASRVSHVAHPSVLLGMGDSSARVVSLPRATTKSVALGRRLGVNIGLGEGIPRRHADMFGCGHSRIEQPPGGRS
jgi:hypothetical protein